MLENSNLNKTDDELRETSGIILVAKLSALSYLKAAVILMVGFWVICGIFAYYTSISYVITRTSFYLENLLNGVGIKNIAFFQTLEEHPEYGVVVIILCIALVLLPSVLKIVRCVKTTLIVDQDGVWLKQGLFSFTREIQGVVWRNADLAISQNNFIYHFTESYPIQIKNRYSGILELSTLPIQNGKEVMKLINRKVSEMNKN